MAALRPRRVSAGMKSTPAEPLSATIKTICGDEGSDRGGQKIGAGVTMLQALPKRRRRNIFGHSGEDVNPHAFAGGQGKRDEAGFVEHITRTSDHNPFRKFEKPAG